MTRTSATVGPLVRERIWNSSTAFDARGPAAAGSLADAGGGADDALGLIAAAAAARGDVRLADGELMLAEEPVLKRKDLEAMTVLPWLLTEDATGLGFAGAAEGELLPPGITGATNDGTGPAPPPIMPASVPENSRQ